MPLTDSAAIALAPAAEAPARQPLLDVLSRAALSCDRARQLAHNTEYVLTENQAIRQVIADARRERLTSPGHRALLQRSAQLRLIARLETMPVIEQAKGIIMAQRHCAEREAFDKLRQASQPANVPVRTLAARIVSQAGKPAA